MPNWRDWSRRPWTSACSILGLCRSAPSWTGYQLPGLRIVSVFFFLLSSIEPS